jgi:hypothetical protein
MMDALIVTFVDRLKQKAAEDAEKGTFDAATDTDGLSKVNQLALNDIRMFLIYRAARPTSHSCEEGNTTTVVLEQQIESIDSGNF